MSLPVSVKKKNPVRQTALLGLIIFKGGFIIKFYKNKRTKYHPSLEISNDGKTWKNLEFTSSPTKTGKYIKLDDNPSGNPKPGFLRKYVRNDPIRTRGDLLPKYKLSNRDRKKVYDYLNNKKASGKQ